MDFSSYSLSERLGILLTALCMAFVLSLILALPVLWIWNSTMPELFGFREITWWTAWKLSFLSNIFFKSSITLKKND
jgi:hypothetical protein